MILLLRGLFGIITFKLVDWGGVFIASLLCEEGASMERILTRSMKNQSMLLALFITLWIISMGWL